MSKERFTVERSSKINFKPPEFLCDQPIHKQIEYPIPNTAFFWCLLGPPGSGKTSYLVNLLTSRQAYKKAFDNVFCIAPPNSIASLKKNIFEYHDKCYSELSWETLSDILERCKEASESKHNSLILIDDMASSMKDSEIQKLLRDISFNRRHYRTSVLVCVQSYIAVPLSVRKVFSHLTAFKVSKKEWAVLSDEMVQLDKETTMSLYRFVFDKPYTSLLIDAVLARYYKNFDRITVNGENQTEGDSEGKEDPSAGQSRKP